jgi:tetratricopeptide (TPR) repeat protein
MIAHSSAAIVLIVALVFAAPAHAQSDSLEPVRQLYASASYEEALSRLSALEQAEAAPPEHLEQYRALCLLGLGRADEAKRSLERLIVSKPSYTIPDADVSPRLVTMFRDIRKRVLPGAAKELYTLAKASFDSKQYGLATTRFAELMAILGDAELTASAPELGDLKVLAQGFQQLAEGQAAAEAKDRADALARARTVAAETPAAAPPRPAAPVIYVDTDLGVTPPADIERRMPAWNPPTQLAGSAQFRGVLEIVVNERGLVDSAIIRDSVAPFYDNVLLEAAMHWKFRPATRNGQPVKFRKFIEIVRAK